MTDVALSRDETGFLALTLDAMLAQLKRRYDKYKRSNFFCCDEEFREIERLESLNELQQKALSAFNGGTAIRPTGFGKVVEI